MPVSVFVINLETSVSILHDKYKVNRGLQLTMRNNLTAHSIYMKHSVMRSLLVIKVVQ